MKIPSKKINKTALSTAEKTFQGETTLLFETNGELHHRYPFTESLIVLDSSCIMFNRPANITRWWLDVIDLWVPWFFPTKIFVYLKNCQFFVCFVEFVSIGWLQNSFVVNWYIIHCFCLYVFIVSTSFYLLCPISWMMIFWRISFLWVDDRTRHPSCVYFPGKLRVFRFTRWLFAKVYLPIVLLQI